MRSVLDVINVARPGNLTEGIVTGLTGGLLAESLLEPIFLACLLVPCTSLFPDALSSARALALIKKFVELDVDTGKLEERAKETEETVMGLVKAVQGGLKKEMGVPKGLYG